MSFPGYKTIRRNIFQLRSHLRKGCVILGYHRVANFSRDIFSLCVSIQNFEEQMDLISTKRHVISLLELNHRIREGKSLEKTAVITFDDGYEDILNHAKPALERFNVPATVFIATGYLGREFWWDELERIVLDQNTPQEILLHHLNKSIKKFEIPKRNDPLLKDQKNPRRMILSSAYDMLRKMEDEERENFMHSLRDKVGKVGLSEFAQRALTINEMSRLVKGGIIEIGSHSVTHPILNLLSQENQKKEIEESKTCLEKLIGKPVTSFSYPNGAWSLETLILVQKAGYTCACQSKNDAVWRGSNLFLLPRLWVNDCNGEEFLRWLDRWN